MNVQKRNKVFFSFEGIVPSCGNNSKQHFFCSLFQAVSVSGASVIIWNRLFFCDARIT